MRTKSIILGTILLFGGASLLSWVLTEQREEEAQATQYQLKYSTQTADFVKQYNEWLQLPPQQRTELPLLLDEDGKAKTRAQFRQEQQERLKGDLSRLATGELTAPPFADVLYGENWQDELRQYKQRRERNEVVVIGSAGSFLAGLSIWAFWLLVWIVQTVRRGVARLRQWRSGEPETSTKAVAPNAEARKAANRKGTTEKPNLSGPGDEAPGQTARRPPGQPQKRPNRANVSLEKPPVVKRDPRVSAEVSQIKRISDEAEKIAKLLSDEESSDSKVLPKSGPVRPEARDQSKPLNNTLKELSQQVSAIREYTAYQQDRLEKLQNGYDWNIIRTFCLRVIRCIDNLESRITQMSEDEVRAAHLEEVKDELVFALESGGIEQFRPEVNSDYRGHEKFAEAVKDKQPCDEPGRAGKIAACLRPGYQYFINEENIKVVRPAQVRLYA